jgi:tetratricopeptide (TPR) repeat protein
MIVLPLLIALAAAPACPDTADAASSLCRAIHASDAKNFGEAAAEFERAAAASPVGDPRTQHLLAAAGNMWIAAGQPDKAAIALDRALAGTGLLADQRGLALLDRARSAEAQGDLKAARRFVTTATQSAADDPFLWYFSAALAIRESDLPTARLAINRALALAPNDADILFEAGHVAEAEGKLAAARDYWQKALDADPAGPTGEAARSALGMVDVPLAVTKSPAPLAKDKK